MTDAAPRKKPSKQPEKPLTSMPPKTQVKSKLPTRAPGKVGRSETKAGPTKVSPATATAVAASKMPAGKKTVPTRFPSRASKLPPKTTPLAAKEDAVQSSTSSSTPRAANMTATPLAPTRSDTSSEGSVHLATYDDMLSPIDTPREMTGIHKVADVGILEQSAQPLEKEESSLKEMGTPNRKVPPKADITAEAAVQVTEGCTQRPVTVRKTAERHAGYVGDIAKQLVKAEERVGTLTGEVARLREALGGTDNSMFVQHTFQAENGVEWLRQELARERASTKHHREAHLAVLLELGKLREEVDRYGTHDLLLKRNAELEAQMSDMAKEKVEQEMVIVRLQEEAAALVSQYGNSPCGSGCVMVRLSSLCELCCEKLKLEANRRTAHDRLAQLTELKPMGVVPHSLPEPWSPEMMKQLQEPRKQAPPLLPTNGAVSLAAGLEGRGGAQPEQAVQDQESP